MTFEYFSSGPDLAGVKDAAKKLAGSPDFRRALCGSWASRGNGTKPCDFGAVYTAVLRPGDTS